LVNERAMLGAAPVPDQSSVDAACGPYMFLLAPS
jgi:hypothetical protein